MPTLNAELNLSYGDAVPAGDVPWRKKFTFNLVYTEESVKIVQIPASTTDFPVLLDTVAAPKFIFARALDTDVVVKVSDGTDDAPTALAAAGGWMMIANPNGQTIDRLLVTTPASPTTGARVQVLAFE